MIRAKRGEGWPWTIKLAATPSWPPWCALARGRPLPSSPPISTNWMWPCKNEGEDARLYTAVQAASDYALALGINIPTGKDSLSMTQKYKDGEQVYAPGTVIITSAGEVSDVKKVISPALKRWRM